MMSINDATFHGRRETKVQICTAQGGGVAILAVFQGVGTT